MSEHNFNPFEDRLSRDIRNDLSEGLAKAVESGKTDKLVRAVENFRRQKLADCYRNYLENRYNKYLKALQIIGAGITDPIERGVVLWDLGLFFEVHEVLEHAWYSAEGNMKLTLQALIRAAGVYIKREFDFHDSALRIADKAIPVLKANRSLLATYFDPEKLISSLEDKAAPPPLLRNDETSLF